MEVISLTYRFTDAVPSGATCIVMSLLFRSIMALGVAGSSTASLAILAKEFPLKIATIDVWDIISFIHII